MAARSSTSSANNETFVPIEPRPSVRDPFLSPPLPYLASLLDTGDRFGFSPSQVCERLQKNNGRVTRTSR